MAAQKEVYMVIGGSGFLGRHIVQALLARGDAVAVFDIVQRYDDTPFFPGDIADEAAVGAALKAAGATCIFHTASPMHGASDPALYWKVNVEGTRAVVAAARAQRVPKLVYTSSSGVTFDGHDIIDGDERLPYPEKAMDAYNDSKARAEQIVLEANGTDGLLTVALRPCGIFGPGDRQLLVGAMDVLKEGKTHWQIGSNTNLFDITYVDNIVHAHLLAAARLAPPRPWDPADPAHLHAAQDALDAPLPPIALTVGHTRVPTSAARPLGPYVERPPDGDALEAAWAAPPPARRAPARTRFDPFSDGALQRSEKHPLDVAGNAFYISNGEPFYFWDLMRAIWRLADPEHYPARGTFVIPRALGFVLASVLEAVGWVTGKEPSFTRFRVTVVVAQRWHNIERARRALGYEPIVGMEEGLKRTMAWWKEEQAKGKA